MLITLIKTTKNKNSPKHGGGRLNFYSEEAERNMLGIIIADNDVLEECNLKIDDFYNPVHKNIYEAMLKLKENNRPIDPISLSDRLKDTNTGVDFKYIAYLATSCDVTGNHEYHAIIIKERAAQRQLIKIAEKMKNTTNNDLSETIEQAINDIQALELAEEKMEGYVPDLIDGVLEEIREKNKGGKMSGIETGFNEFNRLTGGWQAGRYYVLGARPKMGKTSLFCQLAEKAAEVVPTVIFSLEMNKEDIMKMLIYQNSKIDGMLEQTGQLTAKNFTKIEEAVKELYERPLFIDDTSNTINEMRASLKKIQKIFHKKGKGNIGLIVVDYLQMMEGDDTKQRNYQLEQISRGLKGIAKKYNACVLALSQLSRNVEGRQDRRPIPSDLRDSGSLEQDCDGLMLMYRDSYYNGQDDKNTTEYNFDGKEIKADIVEINFFLNRYGATGVLKFDFIKPFRRFFNHGENKLLDLASGYVEKQREYKNRNRNTEKPLWYEVEKPDDCPF